MSAMERAMLREQVEHLEECALTAFGHERAVLVELAASVAMCAKYQGEEELAWRALAVAGSCQSSAA